MKHFVYFSSSASTSAGFRTDNLMKAGRMDIAIHVLINTFFVSRQVREDIKLHLIFYGMPDPPKHIEITLKQQQGIQKEGDSLDVSKKDIAGLIKRALRGYKQGEKREALPGVFVEKKSFLKVIGELEKENEIFILDKRGEDLRDSKILKNCVFVIGDHNGLPKKELKRLKKTATAVSIGPKMYFASQVITLLNNELDRRGI